MHLAVGIILMYLSEKREIENDVMIWPRVRDADHYVLLPRDD